MKITELTLDLIGREFEYRDQGERKQTGIFLAHPYHEDRLVLHQNTESGSVEGERGYKHGFVHSVGHYIYRGFHDINLLGPRVISHIPFL